MAGNETTRNAIAHGLLALTEHPDQKQRWLDDIDGLAPTAVEEIVRWATPVIHFRRTVTQDGVRLGDHEFSEGDKVVLWYWSGQPRRGGVRPTRTGSTSGRTPNDHIGFGGPGPHFCLGAHLARREITVMFRELFAACPTSTRSASPTACVELHQRHQAPPRRVDAIPLISRGFVRTRVRRTAKKIGYGRGATRFYADLGGERGVVAGDLDDRLVAVVPLGAQRPAHRGVHLVQARDVGQLEDLLVGQVLLQGGEHTVRHPPPLEHQGVRVGQHRPLGRRPAVGHGPGGSAAIFSSGMPSARHDLACCE